MQAEIGVVRVLTIKKELLMTGTRGFIILAIFFLRALGYSAVNDKAVFRIAYKIYNWLSGIAHDLSYLVQIYDFGNQFLLFFEGIYFLR